MLEISISLLTSPAVVPSWQLHSHVELQQEPMGTPMQLLLPPPSRRLFPRQAVASAPVGNVGRGALGGPGDFPGVAAGWSLPLLFLPAYEGMREDRYILGSRCPDDH